MKCQALMYGNIFVDTSKLGGGFYESRTPSLYGNKTTIESLVEISEKYLRFNPAYINALKQCKLVPVEVKVIEEQPLVSDKIAVPEFPPDRITGTTPMDTGLLVVMIVFFAVLMAGFIVCMGKMLA